MKHLLILAFLTLQIVVFAQKPFNFALKINPYTMLTGRYGANVEIPLSKDFSMTLEGRYLTKDWNAAGGEVFNSLKKSKGINAIAGLRCYVPIEKKYRWYVSAEYRYRKAKFDVSSSTKEFNEGNIITGIQLLPAKTNFTIDFGMGTGITSSKRIDAVNNTVYKRNHGVIRIDILLGYRF